MTNSILKQSGILGMKWGRRKANSGSESSDHQSVSSLRKKKVSEMSNDDLKTLTNRLQLERSVKDLSKKDHGAAVKFVSDIALGTSKQLLSKYLAGGIETAVSAAVSAARGN